MPILNAIKNLSPPELIIILLILIVLFGSKAMIKLGKTGGETLKEIKSIKKSFTDALEGEDSTKKKKKEVSK